MVFEYSKLRGRIIEKCGTAENFSKTMGLTPNQTSRLMNNHQDWRPSKILQACKVLDIDVTDIGTYFFTEKFKKT